MDDNLKTISVTLAGRKYPIVTSAEEESTVQQINVQLEKEFAELRKKYASKLNKQDILAMLLFTYAKKLHESQVENDLTPVIDQINTIDHILDKAFQKES